MYSLFLPGRLPLLLVDLVVGVAQFDLRIVGQAGRDDVQLQVLVVLKRETIIWLNDLKLHLYHCDGKICADGSSVTV